MVVQDAKGNLSLGTEDCSAVEWVVRQEDTAYDYSLYPYYFVEHIQREGRENGLAAALDVETVIQLGKYACGLSRPAPYAGCSLAQTGVTLVTGASGVEKNSFVDYVHSLTEAWLPKINEWCTVQGLNPVHSITTQSANKKDIEYLITSQTGPLIQIHHEFDAWQCDLFGAKGVQQQVLASHLGHYEGRVEQDGKYYPCAVSGMIGAQLNSAIRFQWNHSANGGAARFGMLFLTGMNDLGVYMDYMCRGRSSHAGMIDNVLMPIIKKRWVNREDQTWMRTNEILLEDSTVLQQYRASLPRQNGHVLYTNQNAREIVRIALSTPPDQCGAVDYFYQYRHACKTEAFSMECMRGPAAYKNRVLKNSTCTAYSAIVLQDLFDVCKPREPTLEIQWTPHASSQAYCCAKYHEGRKLAQQKLALNTVDKLLRAMPSNTRAFDFVIDEHKKAQDIIATSPVIEESETEFVDKVHIAKKIDAVGQVLTFGSSLMCVNQLKRTILRKMSADEKNELFQKIVHSQIGFVEGASVFEIDALNEQGQVLETKNPKVQMLHLRSVDAFHVDDQPLVQTFLGSSGLSKHDFESARRANMRSPKPSDFTLKRKPAGFNTYIVRVVPEQYKGCIERIQSNPIRRINNGDEKELEETAQLSSPPQQGLERTALNSPRLPSRVSSVPLRSPSPPVLNRREDSESSQSQPPPPQVRTSSRLQQKARAQRQQQSEAHSQSQPRSRCRARRRK